MTRVLDDTSLRAFRHRNFAIFWWASLISNSAGWLQIVVVPLILYDLTESNAWVGASALAAGIPAILLTPAAGVLADRVSRRVILAASQAAQGALSIALWGLWETGNLDSASILIVQLMSGVAVGLQVPTWQSFVPSLVPRSYLLDAIRLNSVQFTLSRAFGPLFGGLALGTIGNGGAFLINGVTFGLVVAAVIVAAPVAPPIRAEREPVFDQFRHGLAVVRRTPSLRQACVTGAVLSFCGQSFVMLTAGFAEEVYDDERSQAFLVSAVGFGSLLAALFLLGAGDRIRRSHSANTGLAIYTLGMLLVAASPRYIVGLLGFFLTGAAHLFVATALNTSTQAQVADEIRGRVLSFYLVGVLAGVPLGAQLWGLCGDVIGLRSAAAMSVGLFVAYGAVTVFRYDRLRSLDLAEV